MTASQISIWKRVGRSLLTVIVGAGVEIATGSPYALIIVPILQGLGKWLREEKEMKLIPF